ncbi:MAG: OsmC family peroxiredoxin, partial [bacterium]|nr:OsmC family peroxiredoxin [bacterium]
MAKTINGVNVDQLVQTVNLIKEKPELGTFRFRAQNQWVNGGHSKTTISGFYGAGAEQTHKTKHVLEGD